MIGRLEDEILQECRVKVSKYRTDADNFSRFSIILTFSFPFLNSLEFTSAHHCQETASFGNFVINYDNSSIICFRIPIIGIFPQSVLARHTSNLTKSVDVRVFPQITVEPNHIHELTFKWYCLMAIECPRICGFNVYRMQHSGGRPEYWLISK